MRRDVIVHFRAEVGINEVTVAFNIVERFPHNSRLFEEALVSDQREELVLNREQATIMLVSAIEFLASLRTIDTRQYKHEQQNQMTTF